MAGGGGVGRGVVVLVTAVALVALAGGIALASGAFSGPTTTSSSGTEAADSSVTPARSDDTTSARTTTRTRAEGGTRAGTPVTISAIQGPGGSRENLESAAEYRCGEAGLDADCLRLAFRTVVRDDASQCEVIGADQDVFTTGEQRSVTVYPPVTATLACPPKETTTEETTEESTTEETTTAEESDGG
jgi:hypothetical protein